jgi:hypothetical protein
MYLHKTGTRICGNNIRIVHPRFYNLGRYRVRDDSNSWVLFQSYPRLTNNLFNRSIPDIPPPNSAYPLTLALEGTVYPSVRTCRYRCPTNLTGYKALLNRTLPNPPTLHIIAGGPYGCKRLEYAPTNLTLFPNHL